MVNQLSENKISPFGGFSFSSTKRKRNPCTLRLRRLSLKASILPGLTDLGLLTIHALVGVMKMMKAMVKMLLLMEKMKEMIVIKKKAGQGWSLGGGLRVFT